MDNQNLEIVSNEAIAPIAEVEPAVVDTNSNKAVTYGAIAVGAVAAVGVGVLLWKFALKPAIQKYKAKKAAEAAESTKSTEEKKEDSES